MPGKIYHRPLAEIIRSGTHFLFYLGILPMALNSAALAIIALDFRATAPSWFDEETRMIVLFCAPLALLPQAKFSPGLSYPKAGYLLSNVTCILAFFLAIGNLQSPHLAFFALLLAYIIKLVTIFVVYVEAYKLALAHIEEKRGLAIPLPSLLRNGYSASTQQIGAGYEVIIFYSGERAKRWSQGLEAQLYSMKYKITCRCRDASTIQAGTMSQKELTRLITSASIIVLMVNASLLSSARRVLQCILEQDSLQKLPLIVESCPYYMSLLSKFQPFSDPDFSDKPLSELPQARQTRVLCHFAIHIARRLYPEIEFRRS
ncbi:hypothetical protein EPA93_01440 [Ktedonosporobacter rubrisoli]|uniref:TIR domain-containing protein n=1 Tax=Ktedonosporobacter rubrisoli TaxID=2509675 RepID=A0A4P6JIC4_KTERU|nr:hypothetical protein [Ktedonosporobacter rubrisoli]QBD74723.1 hypothetical protein EPA93_01440 [Ktedonosporobacter rubrisoli]